MFRRVLLILALVLSVSGCSLLFVDGPPQVRPGAEAPTTSSCTAEMTLPILDLVFGALNGLGGAVLLAGGDETMTEEESNQLGVWGLVWGGVLLVSGTSGRQGQRMPRLPCHPGATRSADEFAHQIHIAEHYPPPVVARSRLARFIARPDGGTISRLW